jgi:hypothetical protein
LRASAPFGRSTLFMGLPFGFSCLKVDARPGERPGLAYLG